MIYLRIGGVVHTIRKLSMRVIIVFKTSSQSNVWKRSYGPSSCNSPNFEIPKLGVPRQNDIWVQAPWPDTNKLIKGKVVVSAKSRLSWVLWVHVRSWLIRVCPWFIHVYSWFICVYPWFIFVCLWFIRVCSWFIYGPKIF
jgi:hypothetical protein